ncbi:MAG: SpoIIE family protein phosphatase [Halanaerobiales bacterium]|nr:SpoIIE family protein phosphatase [Halanaerobiales bacterium]
MNLIYDTGVSSLNKYGEELCGDKVEFARTENSLIIVLSDGLGSGVKANILATLTTKIIVTMLKNGARLEDVLDTVGNTLPICKIRNLAYSTFTIVQIDYEKEEAYVVEFDNPGTIFLRERKLFPLEMRTRMIADKEIRECHFKMKEGDLLVALSDGVVHAGVGGILNLGWQWENVAHYLEKVVEPEQDAISSARWLTDVCKNLYSDRPGDDTTVLAIKARYPNKTIVVVGPPEDSAKDRYVSQLLELGDGKKVVCGGTTSKIIAREMNKELKVKLSSLNSKIPPCGEIEGVDLVTEGVLTLSRTLEILKQSRIKEEIRGNDGASELAKILKSSDVIHFVVGKAINPVYQNPDLPIDFGFKMRLVESLENYLKDQGKEIKVQYF